jgi:N-acetylmuramoyl-L-alanine amidase
MKPALLSLAVALAVGSTAVTASRPDAPPAATPAAAVPDAGSARHSAADSGWSRPAGPPRVALQAGHWRAAEAPDEQAGLRNNGTRGGGKQEWEVNLAIARRTAALLEGSGYVVEILPTTIPPGHWADLFVSIHADGHASPSVSGFRAAAPRRDATGRASEFAALLERSYAEATGLSHYPNLTRRMQNYYAFNWRRYEHALHPMTTAVILETGFLTSPADRRVIVDAPDLAARGIAEAVRLYLETTRLQPRVVAAPGRTAPHLD